MPQPDGGNGIGAANDLKSESKTTNQRISLTYDDPLTAVFLRSLAWEIHEAGRKPLVKELVSNQVQTAREDLGLERNTAGAPHAFIQSLRKRSKPLISSDPTEPLEKGWQEKEKAWRLYSLPSHRLVRMLSRNPIMIPFPKIEHSDFIQYCLKLRSPATPTLLVTVGINRPSQKELGAPRGLYFLREAQSLYVGQSEEFETRWTGHKAKSVKWWVFIAPKDQQETFSSDSLDAAEALLISFWNEVCELSNRQRGKDKKPSPAFFQQAVIFVEAASAAFLWLIREKKDLSFTPWTLPFKPLRGRQGRRWPECYMAPDNDTMPLKADTMSTIPIVSSPQ